MAQIENIADGAPPPDEKAQTGAKIRPFFRDCRVMTARCMRLSMRNPELIIMSVFVPALIMGIFVALLGGAMDTDNFDTTYINYIVSGVVILAIGQSASSTATVVCSDVHKGILDRFVSMPVSRASYLIGHVTASTIRNIVATIFVTAVAFLMGFRPEASVASWFAAIGLLFVFMLALTWISVAFGLFVKEPEGAGLLVMLIQVVTYISSALVPTETMPKFLRGFANHQPLSPVIDTIRSLFLADDSGRWIAALLWCAGLLIAGFALSLFLFKRRAGR